MSCHVYQISSYKVKLDSGSILLIRYNFGLSKFATTLWTKMADFLSFHARLLETFFGGEGGGQSIKYFMAKFPIKMASGAEFSKCYQANFDNPVSENTKSHKPSDKAISPLAQAVKIESSTICRSTNVSNCLRWA